MGDAIQYLEDGMPVEVVFYDGKAISVELPTSAGARDHRHRAGRQGRHLGQGAEARQARHRLRDRGAAVRRRPATRSRSTPARTSTASASDARPACRREQGAAARCPFSLRDDRSMPFDFVAASARRSGCSPACAGSRRARRSSRRIAPGIAPPAREAGRAVGASPRRRCSPIPASTTRRRSRASAAQAARRAPGRLRRRRRRARGAADRAPRSAGRSTATPARRRRRPGDRRAACARCRRAAARAACSPRLRRRLRRHRRQRRATIPWLAVCLPSRWAPEEKVGRRFAEVHAPVADNAVLIAGERRRWRASSPATSAGSASSGRSAPTRACTSIRRAVDAGWPAADGRRRRARRRGLLSQRAPDLHPDAGAAAGGLHDPRRERAARRRRRRAPDARAGCTTRSRQMSPAVLAYRGLDGVRDRLLDWLAARAAHDRRAVKTRRSSRRGSSSTPTARRDRAEFGDVYHPRSGALAQARHVFLGGDALRRALARPRPLRRSLETGFGLGNNFLATWARVARRPGALPPARTSSRSSSRRRRAPTCAARTRDVGAARRWRPSSRAAGRRSPATCTALALRRRRASSCCSRFGDVARRGCRSWSPSVDAFFLDGFAPARNPAMWEPRVFKAMARLAAPDATVATWSVARARARRPRGGRLRRSRTRRASAASATSRARRFAPRFAPRARGVGGGHGGRARPASRPRRDRRRRTRRLRAARVRSPSAGIASLVARAPADARAAKASGNAGRRVPRHRPSPTTARMRASIAPLRSPRPRRRARRSSSHGMRGSASGLLRLSRPARAWPRCSAVAAQQGCPADYVEAVDADDARGSPASPCRSPRLALSRAADGSIRAGSRTAWLASAGAAARLRTAARSPHCSASATPGGCSDAAGTTIATAPVVVVCNGGGALSARRPGRCVAQRGQISALRRRRPRPATTCRGCRSPATATSCRRSTARSGSARARPGMTTTRGCATPMRVSMPGD